MWGIVFVLCFTGGSCIELTDDERFASIEECRQYAPLFAQEMTSTLMVVAPNMAERSGVASLGCRYYEESQA